MPEGSGIRRHDSAGDVRSGSHGIHPKGQKWRAAEDEFPTGCERAIKQHEFIPLRHYPTILVMPLLYLPSSIANDNNADDPFNFQIQHQRRCCEVEALCTRQVLISVSRLVRFSQMIAKIAHVYAAHHFGEGAFIPKVADFIRSDDPPATPVTGHFAHIRLPLAGAGQSVYQPS